VAHSFSRTSITNWGSSVGIAMTNVGPAAASSRVDYNDAEINEGQGCYLPYLKLPAQVFHTVTGLLYSGMYMLT
jgi:hypothetical protein